MAGRWQEYGKKLDPSSESLGHGYMFDLTRVPVLEIMLANRLDILGEMQ